MYIVDFYGAFVIYRIFFTHLVAEFSLVQSTKVAIEESNSNCYRLFTLSLVNTKYAELFFTILILLSLRTDENNGISVVSIPLSQSKKKKKHHSCFL